MFFIFSVDCFLFHLVELHCDYLYFFFRWIESFFLFLTNKLSIILHSNRFAANANYN